MLKHITFYYIILLFILLIYPTIRLFIVWFKHLSLITFEISDPSWNGSIEKPKLYFGFIGYIFIFIAFKLINLEGIPPTLVEKTTFVFFFLFFVLSLLGVFILYFIWSDVFCNKFIRFTKNKIKRYSHQSIVNSDEYNIEKIHLKLSQHFIRSEYSTFLDLIELNETEEKITWKSSVVSLIRFIFILFRIGIDSEKNLNQTLIRNIIRDYFLINGESVKLTETGTEISNVKSEIAKDSNIFVSFRKEILLLIESCKLT